MTMSVWKKQSVKWFKGEKRSKKGVTGAEPRTLYSKRFYGTLNIYDNKKRQVPLTEDQDTSEALLKTLQRLHQSSRTAREINLGASGRLQVAIEGEEQYRHPHQDTFNRTKALLV